LPFLAGLALRFFAFPFADFAGMVTYVPGNAAYIAAQRTRCSIGTLSLTV